jgi:hypothetical protein
MRVVVNLPPPQIPVLTLAGWRVKLNQNRHQPQDEPLSSDFASQWHQVLVESLSLFPFPKSPLVFPKGLYGLTQELEGSPWPAFLEQGQRTFQRVHWAAGGGEQIWGFSLDPREPACPSDSDVSAVFCLITGLSILSQSLQVSNYVEHKHVYIHSFFFLKMPEMSRCLEGLVLLRGPSRDHYTYTFCCPQQQEFYMQLYLYADLHDSSRPHFRCINIYPDSQSSLYLWPWLTKHGAHNAWQANINLRKQIFHIMQTKPPSHPCSNFASMGVLTATITYTHQPHHSQWQMVKQNPHHPCHCAGDYWH